MSKVVKFGGSSLASAEQFKKVGNIIRADKERKYVVPSAPGKRFSNDTKVTDMLYACYDLADQGKSFKAELDAIKARYQEIIDGVCVVPRSIEEEVFTRALEKARGERMVLKKIQEGMKARDAFDQFGIM